MIAKVLLLLFTVAIPTLAAAGELPLGPCGCLPSQAPPLAAENETLDIGDLASAGGNTSAVADERVAIFAANGTVAEWDHVLLQSNTPVAPQVGVVLPHLGDNDVAMPGALIKVFEQPSEAHRGPDDIQELLDAEATSDQPPKNTPDQKTSIVHAERSLGEARGSIPAAPEELERLPRDAPVTAVAGPGPYEPAPHDTEATIIDGSSSNAVWIPVAVAATVATAVWLWYRLIPLLGALFTRITRRTADKQPARRMLLDLLEQAPGQTVAAMMEASGLAEGTIRYHMRILQRHRLVDCVFLGHSALFFPKTRDPYGRSAQARSLLLCPRNQEIVEAVCAEPGINQGAIANRINLAQSQVHARTQRLVEQELLKRTRDGRRVVYYPGRLVAEQPASAGVPAATLSTGSSVSGGHCVGNIPTVGPLHWSIQQG